MTETTTCPVCDRIFGKNAEALGGSSEPCHKICKRCWRAVWRSGGWKCPHCLENVRELLFEVFDEPPVGNADVVEYIKAVTSYSALASTPPLNTMSARILKQFSPP